MRAAPVLLDATPIDTEHRFRGIGSYLRGLLTGFDEVGYEPKVLRQVRRLGTGGRVFDLSANEVCVVRPPRPKLRFDWLWNELWLRREVHRVRVGLFHATDPAGIPISARFRTVATVYDVIPLVFPSYLQGLSPDRRFGYERSLRNLGRAHHIIAISEFTKAEVVSRLGIDPARITVIPLAVDAPRGGSRPDPAQTRERLGLPERYVVYAGSLEEHKRVFVAVEAARRAKTVLAIAGHHTPAQRAALARFTERCGATAHVRYLGWVAVEEIDALYRAASALVFPSAYEGFGLPVLEAMASGCAVITTRAASLPEVAGDAALLVEVDDASALGDAIVRLVEDGALRQRLVTLGSDRARLFTWGATARATAATYQRVLAQSA